jgi:ribonuclease T1
VSVPQKALDVLEAIEKTGAAPKGFRGGEKFENRGALLPPTDSQGHSIAYQEWDIHPYFPSVNRGAERLVTGSDAPHTTRMITISHSEKSNDHSRLD